MKYRNKSILLLPTPFWTLKMNNQYLYWLLFYVCDVFVAYSVCLYVFLFFIYFINLFFCLK